jgi:hypothetical protein
MPLVQDGFSIKSAISLIIILFLTSIHAEEVESAGSEIPPAKIFDMFDENEDLQGTHNLQESKVLSDSDNAKNFDNTQGMEQKEEKIDDLSTSEKLEALKQQVIAVNRDLFILEEDLLFPASTQVALYFSVDIGYFFALDNLKLKIDDKQVTHHLYTEKDVDALYRGAIQKAYIGNVNSGEHELVALIVGTGPHNRAYRKAVSFTFKKTTGAKAIEIQLRDDSGKMQPVLNVVEW